MILDSRIRYVEKIKRQLNHYHNGVKNCKPSEIKVRYFMGRPPKVVKDQIDRIEQLKKKELLLNTRQALYLFNMSRDKLYRLCRDGEVRHFRIKGRFFFLEQDLKNAES